MIDLAPLIAAARPTHTSRLPIRWGEMDAMRHLNNAMYLRLMEENRIEWLRSLQIKLGGSKAAAPVMMNVYCEFLKPITYPSIVDATVLVGELGRSSAQTFHTLAVDGTVYAQAGVKLVWIDPLSGKSTAIPDEVRTALMAGD
jgi:acyl-CoA thioester hydrolase